MSAAVAFADVAPDDVPASWLHVHAAAPQLALTMVAYVAQMGVSMRPATAKAIDTDLRIFAGFLIEHDPALDGAGDVERSHIEAFKLWQWAQPGRSGQLKPATFRRRMGQLRTFFIRITEWGWHDAPLRVPIFFGDVPKRDDSLPRFLDDARFSQFMRALAAEPRIRRRVAIELLARTGMRIGELCALEADAVTIIGDGHWLRVPLGKLHNDRYVPLHPHLVELLDSYRDTHGVHAHGRLLSGEQGPPQPLRRSTLDHRHRQPGRHRSRPPPPAAPHPGHPSHQPGHADRGHRRPPQAPLPRHDTALRPHLEPGRRQRVRRRLRQGRSLYCDTNLPADAEGPNMRKLRQEVHHRLLGNGWCQRPAALDCYFESICETCTHFATDTTFQPVLLRQRDHATRNHQDGRATLFSQLLDHIDPAHPDSP